MIVERQTKSNPLVQLDHILTSAVILNWEALTPSSPTGRVRSGISHWHGWRLGISKLWGSAREYWEL